MGELINTAKTTKPRKKIARLEGAEPNSQFKGGFTGRDWTKYTQQEQNSIMQRLANMMPSFGNGEVRDRSLSLGEAMAKRRKVLISGGIAALLLLAAIIYLILFVYASVDVSITLVKTEIPVEQKINVDADLDALSEDDQLTIPATVLRDNELSISESANATGKSTRGDKAKGTIQLWNKKDTEVTIAVGTVVKSASNSRNYVIREEVKLPAANDDGGVVDFGIVEDIRVEAAKIGAEFDITASEIIDFNVTGFSSEEVIGKMFSGSSISGGTSEEFVSVSKKDVENLTKKLKAELTQEGLDRLRSELPDGYRLIEGTEVFEETAVTTDPKEGEEAETFVLDMQGKISALAVSEDDLNAALQIVVLTSQESENEFNVTDLDDVSITEVKRDGRKASFLVTSKGSLQSALTVDDVRAAIGGKSIEAARTYLSSQDDIEGFKLIYSPGFIPESMQRIPADVNKVSIRIK